MTYYTATGNPVQQTRGTSPAIRNEFALIQTAFGMLPSATALAGGSANYAADNGIANAYAVTISAQITAYYDGLEVVFKAGNANTGVSTINVNTLGLITITRPDGAALQANDIFAGQIVTIAYSGTTNTFQLSYSCLAAANAAASSASSAASSASSASGSASAAASSATAAASSAASASGSASSASTSATTASTSATNAASSATSASTSASTATTQASNASSSATSAATSASNAATSATNAATSASNAANSAANAAASATLAGQVFSGTSSTSLTIGTGTQTFTTQPSLAFVVSNPVTIANSGSHYMTGVVSSYNSSTGAMTVSVNATVGSGTYTTWSIGVTPPLVGATLTNPALVDPALGTPISGVATNLTGTASGLTAGTANALNPANTYSVSGMNGGQLAGLRNRIINGDMRIAQRGTSSSAGGYCALDRWLLNYASAVITMSQVVGPPGYKYAMQLTGGAGNTGSNVLQRIESSNCADLVGKTVALSCNLQASAAQTVGWVLFYANSVDSFSAITQIAFGTWNATTSATEFSATVASLPAGAANGLLLEIQPNTNGPFTSGTLNITGVQLEVADPVNPVATPFEQRPIGLELALCQRYYEISQALPAAAFNSSDTVVTWNFTVQKRAAPTITLPTVGLVVGNGGSLTPTLAGVSFNSPQSATFDLTVSGGVAGFAYIWRGGLVAASAEL